MLIEWIKTCYSNQEIKKKEVNLQSPKNYNIIINKDQNNNNTQVQTKSNNIKEKNTTSNSPNIKNLGVQKEELERFSSLSEMDLSPVSKKNSGNGKNTIPPKVKSFNKNLQKKRHAHFPKLRSQKLESDFDKDKKIKKIRNHLMEDLF